MPEGAFKISPSQLSRFFDETSGWYRECLLKEEGARFQGNDNSHLGTVVHGLAEMYVKEGKADFAKAEAYIASIKDPDIDKEYIRSNYPHMFEALRGFFLEELPEGTKSEPFMNMPINEARKIYLGGSIDLLLPNQIVDFKTTSALSAPSRIPRNYWFQQMCYVYMARSAGMNIDSFALVYVTTDQVGRISEKTGKPMKDYPATASILEHIVTDDDMRIITDVVRLVSDSVICWQDNPDMRYLLAQDLRLKTASTQLFV